MARKELVTKKPGMQHTLVSNDENTRHVLVSSVEEIFDHPDSETMLFWADEHGKPHDWQDLDVWIPKNHEAGCLRAEDLVRSPGLEGERAGTRRGGILGMIMDYLETPHDNPE